MSLENLQTLSKLKKICVHIFFQKKYACTTQKQVVDAYIFLSSFFFLKKKQAF